MKNVFVLLLLPVMSVSAQTQSDSIKKRAGKAITNKFPTTRFLDLQYEQFSETDYDSEYKRKDLEEGTIKSQRRFKAAMNVQLIKKPTWSITASARYKLESFDIEKVRNVSEDFQDFPLTKSEDYHFFSTSLSYTKFSMLFKKPVMFNATVTADGSDEGYERITGMILTTLILKKNERTTIGAGFVAFVDPASQFPALPVFTYEHQFAGSAWTLDLIVPRYIYMRRPLLENGRLSLGSAFESEGFYTYTSQSGFANVNSFSRNEVKTGFIYEYHLNKSLIATFRGGVANIFGGQLSERGERRDKDNLEVKQDMNGYFNIGFSYNPF